jgi:alcohol dehydrogenase class IV
MYLKNNSVRFSLNTELICGGSVYRELPGLIESFSQSVLILVDENVCSIEPVKFLRDALEKKGLTLNEILLRGTEEPDYDYLDEVSKEARNLPCDLIIAIGGGSTLDLAKAVSILLTNPGSGLDYRGFDKVQVPGIPLMAIPTTAGTGSEVTINAVFTNKQENKKLGINGSFMNAKYAVLDPHFTCTAPLKVSVSAGVDAMVHVLESFVTSNAPPTNYTFSQRQNSNFVTQNFAREAFSLLYHNLPTLIEDPPNMDRLLNIQLGAYYAGISLLNSGSGIAGAMSYPLGVHYKIPHGICGGMFALPVVRYNVSNGYYDYQLLHDQMNDADLSLDPQSKCDRFIELMQSLFDSLEVPDSLAQFGVGPDSYEHVLEIMQGMQGAFDQNPVPLKTEDAGILLKPFFK